MSDTTDAAWISGVIGLGGVVVGFGLNATAAARTRKQVSAEERERERRQRELVVAERLDDALVKASAALDRGSATLPYRYREAHDHWQEAWVAYSGRLRQPELLRRYQSVGTLLLEAADDLSRIPLHIAARAVANARAALAWFMRGDDRLPPNAFPEPDDLRSLLGRGDGQPDPARPLKDWLDEHALPEFHPPDD